MEEEKIDGIPIGDYGRPTSQTFYTSSCETIDLSNQPKAKLTCGIEKLKMISNPLFLEAPNNKMLMDKINEIIDYLDSQVRR